MSYITADKLIKDAIELHKHFLHETDEKEMIRLRDISSICRRAIRESGRESYRVYELNHLILDNFKNKSFSVALVLHDKCCEYIESHTFNRHKLKDILLEALDIIAITAEKNILLTPHFRYVALSRVNRLDRHTKRPYKAIKRILEGKRAFITRKAEDRLKSLSLDFIQQCVNMSTLL